MMSSVDHEQTVAAAVPALSIPLKGPGLFERWKVEGRNVQCFGGRDDMARSMHGEIGMYYIIIY